MASAVTNGRENCSAEIFLRKLACLHFIRVHFFVCVLENYRNFQFLENSVIEYFSNVLALILKNGTRCWQPWKPVPFWNC